MAFIQLTSPLILAGDPTLPNHAATKQYVDNKANNIDAAGFSSGLLNVMRLPALVGDVTMAAGSGTLVLPPTGVAAGTYTKVVLNTSGRITAAGVLAADDMPNISWGKITSGLPTTLAGYGITNVIGMSGGTITGTLTSTAVPSASLHLVTKSYVDSMIHPSGDSLTTGDIVRKGIVSTSPSGFLRANGSKVSKVTYAALYSILGDRYEVLLTSGIEMPFAHQERLNLAGSYNGLNTTQAVTVGSGPVLGVGIENVRFTFVTHNKLFLVNSVNNGVYTQGYIWYANINSDGSLGQITYVMLFAGTDVIRDNTRVEVFYTLNKVWFGIEGDTTGHRGNLYVSTINVDGTITTPTLHSNPPGWKHGTRPVIIKNRLYLIDYNYSGIYGAVEVVYSTIGSDGSLSGYTSLGSISASTIKDYVIDAFVYKNKLIAIMADSTRTTSTYVAWYASINSDGTISAWTAGPSINTLNNIRARAITSTSGIFIPFTSTYQWFYNAELDYIYKAYAYKYLTLTTNADGVPISWDVSGVLGETGSEPIDRKSVVVPNRVYIQFSDPTFKYMGYTGGLATYNVYYDGTYTVSDPNNFYLPDFTSKETANTKYYVKT